MKTRLSFFFFFLIESLDIQFMGHALVYYLSSILRIQHTSICINVFRVHLSPWQRITSCLQRSEVNSSILNVYPLKDVQIGCLTSTRKGNKILPSDFGVSAVLHVPAVVDLRQPSEPFDHLRIASAEGALRRCSFVNRHKTAAARGRWGRCRRFASAKCRLLFVGRRQDNREPTLSL